MKIAHLADTHIKNLKYHDEYREIFSKIYEKFNIKFIYVDTTDPKNVSNAITSNTKLIWIESDHQKQEQTNVIAETKTTGPKAHQSNSPVVKNDRAASIQAALTIRT